MDNVKWRNFFLISRRILGEGDCDPSLSTSWCAYTTFTSLQHGVYYFNSGFPEAEFFMDLSIADGSAWRQAVAYDDLAHIVVPGVFYWEKVSNGFTSGYKYQNIIALSDELTSHGIKHQLTDQLLEIKLY